MTFIEFLDYQNGLSLDVREGLNHLTVYDKELKISVTFRGFESYLYAVNRLPLSSESATWECGKSRGKTHDLYKKRYFELRQRLIELARDYVAELNAMVTDAFGTI